MARTRGRRHLLSVFFVTALLGFGACAESDLQLGSDRVPSGDPSAPAEDVRADEAVDLALADLEAYWAEELPATYGIEFEPLADYVPYGPSTPVPQCGPTPLRYEDVAENALYCPEEDLIGWDEVGLMPDLEERFGPLTVGIVMAHEFAHAIQARAEVGGETVTLELQADCFAGAWVADVRERIGAFSTEGDALDQAIGGFLELRDTVGVAGNDPAAHGSGFDRVSAFQDGFESGNDRCAGYEAEPPPVVAIPFGSITDLENEGNLPLDELVEPLIADLESYYEELFDLVGEEWDPIDGLEPIDPATDEIDCGGETLEGEELELASFWCAEDDTIYLDQVDLVPSLDEIGDFAFGGEVARQYAFAAIAKGGFVSEDDDATADCLTGAYTVAQYDQTIPDQQLVLSPGDIDEILIAFLAFGGADESTAFERTAAFRAGFLEGAAGCDAVG